MKTSSLPSGINRLSKTFLQASTEVANSTVPQLVFCVFKKAKQFLSLVTMTLAILLGIAQQSFAQIVVTNPIVHGLYLQE